MVCLALESSENLQAIREHPVQQFWVSLRGLSQSHDQIYLVHLTSSVLTMIGSIISLLTQSMRFTYYVAADDRGAAHGRLNSERLDFCSLPSGLCGTASTLSFATLEKMVGYSRDFDQPHSLLAPPRCLSLHRHLHSYKIK